QFINAVSIFIIPPLVFAYLVTKNKSGYFKMDRLGPFIIYLIIPAVMVTAMPLINFMAELNQNVQLPEFLAGVERWMQTTEERAERVTKVFLKMDDVSGLMVNLLIIAIIPA